MLVPVKNVSMLPVNPEYEPRTMLYKDKTERRHQPYEIGGDHQDGVHDHVIRSSGKARVSQESPWSHSMTGIEGE